MAANNYISFKKYWSDYRASFVPDDAGREQVLDTRRAFEAGVLVGFEKLYSAFDPLKKMTKGSAEYDETAESIHNHLAHCCDEVKMIGIKLAAARLRIEAVDLTSLDPHLLMQILGVMLNDDDKVSAKKEKH